MLNVNPSPCNTCPYRKDTPPGVWSADEYEKLRGYDDPQTAFGTFLCHADLTRKTACKGWVVVAAESAAARLAVMIGLIPDACRYELPTVELYATGNEAADAGQAEVEHPDRAACDAIAKIAARRKINELNGIDIAKQPSSKEDKRRRRKGSRRRSTRG